MTKKSDLFIGVPLFVCILVSCVSGGQTRSIVSKFKQSEVGRAFLINHSEKDLEIVLSFQRDPLRNFEDVQRVADVCSYIYAYANYLAETKQKDDAGYMGFFSKRFRIATDENVPVLTYLVLNCHNAFLMEAIADRYTVLFKVSPEIFVKDHGTQELRLVHFQVIMDKKRMDALANSCLLTCPPHRAPAPFRRSCIDQLRSEIARIRWTTRNPGGGSRSVTFCLEGRAQYQARSAHNADPGPRGSAASP